MATAVLKYCTINKRVSSERVLILSHSSVDEVWSPLLTK